MKTLKRFTSKDHKRPSLNEIHQYYGYLYAADANIAIRKKGKLEGRDRTDKKAAKFLRSYYKTSSKDRHVTINAHDKCEAMKAIHGIPQKRAQNTDELIRIFDGIFNWAYVYRALRVFKGEKVTVYERKEINLVVFKGKEYEIVIMRKMYGSMEGMR